jgi:hypothetical protein
MMSLIFRTDPVMVDDAHPTSLAVLIPHVVGRLANSPNALPRIEINFDAHSENLLKQVEMPI